MELRMLGDMLPLTKVFIVVAFCGGPLALILLFGYLMLKVFDRK